VKPTDRDPDIPSGAAVIPLGPDRIRIQSRALFRGHREIVILREGTEYRLRITKGDELILTK